MSACDDDSPAPPPIYTPPPPTLTPPRASQVAPEIAPLPPRPNPYTAELGRRREAWQAHGLKSYVFVLQDIGQIAETNEYQRRIVVKDGVAGEAQSLLWGGKSRGPSHTMDDLFESARYLATFGDGNVPFRFAIEYDEHHDFVRRLESDGRDTVADDEHDFTVHCFSTDPDGCRPILLTPKQCRGAGGTVLPIGSLECSATAIGLVGTDRFCCRPTSTPGYDDITAAQCRAAGGVEDVCDRAMISVGSSRTRETECCRRFVE